MKTWEIQELIDRHPNQMLGKNFKLIKNILDQHNVGDVATISKFPGFLGLTRNGCRITRLTGFEEWEEVKEPVSFQRVLHVLSMDSGDRLLSVVNNLYKVNIKAETLDVILDTLSQKHSDVGLANILLSSDWYIE